MGARDESHKWMRGEQEEYDYERNHCLNHRHPERTHKVMRVWVPYFKLYQFKNLGGQMESKFLINIKLRTRKNNGVCTVLGTSNFDRLDESLKHTEVY